MHGLDFFRNSAIAIAASGLLSGCGGSLTGLASAPAVSISGSAKAHFVADAPWVRAEAKDEDLFYTVDASNAEINMFTYPQGRLVGHIPGLSFGNDGGGACVDQMGNVFITAWGIGGGGIYEYAHASKTPSNIIGDAATACAIDSTSGNLAALEGQTVKVYPHATGSPTPYSLNIEMGFCTYDNAGNLFVDGRYGNRVVLAELPKGGSSFISLNLDTAIFSGSVSAVQWDGSYVTLAIDRNTKPFSRTIYRLDVSGSDVTIVDSVVLEPDHSPIIGQSWIEQGTVIAAVRSGRYHSHSSLWSFPAGGKPEKFTKRVYGVFVGVTVSLAPNKPHPRL